MKRKIAITAIVFVSVLVLLVVTFLSFKFKEPEKIKECVVDSDCVKVQVTCCPCSMGGKEECVSKDKVSFYKKKLEQCPKNIVCTMTYNCNISKCKCIEGKCTGLPK